MHGFMKKSKYKFKHYLGLNDYDSYMCWYGRGAVQLYESTKKQFKYFIKKTASKWMLSIYVSIYFENLKNTQISYLKQ